MSKLNRKLVCLFLSLLVGCAIPPTTPPFVYNQDCPHICWLNINPGVATMEDVQKLLNGSKQISYLDKDDSGFRIKWHTKQMSERTADVYVGVVGENGIVSAVNLLFPGNITVKNFIDLLGEPDEISVIKDVAEVIYIDYILYYRKANALIYATDWDLTGPKMTDPVSIVYLNLDLSSSNLPNWVIRHQNLRQPWLGFGKMNEYLLKR
jgi:hypothetical protein